MSLPFYSRIVSNPEVRPFSEVQNLKAKTYLMKVSCLAVDGKFFNERPGCRVLYEDLLLHH